MKKPKSVKDVSFDVFLNSFENGKLITIDDNEREDVFFNGVHLISKYPDCRQMVIDAVHKYEQTGIVFQVSYNRIEDSETQKDVPPIVLYFPGG